MLVNEVADYVLFALNVWVVKFVFEQGKAGVVFLVDDDVSGFVYFDD